MKISHVQNLHIWVQTKIKLMKQILPIRGKVLAHVGQAAFPLGASIVPVFRRFTVLAHG